MKNIINSKLSEVEKNKNIKIIGAYEVGIHSWEFPSIDSFYDVFFIYINNDKENGQDEFEISEGRLEENIRLSGFELDKVVDLLIKSDMRIIEYLTSSICYIETNISKDLINLIPHYFNLKEGLLYNARKLRLTVDPHLKYDTVRLKQYFIALRLSLTLLWLKEEQTLPPINYLSLANKYLPEKLKKLTNDLYEMKIESPDTIFINKDSKLQKFIKDVLKDINNYLKEFDFEFEADKSIALNFLDNVYLK